MGRHRSVAVAVVALLFVSACARTETQTNGTSSSTAGTGNSTTTTAADATALAQGGFGDLPHVCQPGTATGATDKGVTDTDIHIGTVTDKSFSGAPGLDKEMYDAAVAFSKWCNAHGGILGRQLVVDDRDAAYSEYPQRVLDSCNTDLALVGGGAVNDNADNGGRVACGLPNFPGYVVTDDARKAGLQVSALPFPIGSNSAGLYVRARAMFPNLTKLGIMTGALPTTEEVRDADLQDLQAQGYTPVYNREYSILCEPDWTSFINEMKTAGVQVLHFIGQPDCFGSLEKAFQTAGWYPDLTLETANMYDSKFAAEAGKYAQNVYVSSAFYPFELAKQNKATQDYLDMMQQYNPSGKVALLGVQALSAVLLFAQSATECGSNLTRTCILQKAMAVHEWTGGGLHGASDPGANKPTNCFATLKAGDGAFTYDKAFTAPTAGNGIFNCDTTNNAAVTKG